MEISKREKMGLKGRYLDSEKWASKRGWIEPILWRGLSGQGEDW